MKKILPLSCLLLLSWMCGPSKDQRNYYQKTDTYPVTGDCRVPVAAIIHERNGEWAGMGSAALRDKELGLFVTARHVAVLDMEYKIFFCGRVYKGQRILNDGITDVGFVSISSRFNPADFPEPYPLADSVSVKERGFIQGIHPHPEDLQEGRVVHHILEKYYDIVNGDMFRNRFQKNECVFDSLPAQVVSLKHLLRNSSIDGMASSEMRDVVQVNLGIEADDDHIISFAGLSGGPTINSKGQILGINSNELGSEGKYIQDLDGKVRYHPRVSMRLVPVYELKRALERLNFSSR